MIQAGQRLVMLSGGPPRAAGLRLAGITTTLQAGDRMAARTGIGTATAAVHLLYDPPTEPGGPDEFRGFYMNVNRLMNR